ncbi:hypothetical protein RvY_11869 [Ramazzottius varieornatus]|uniref:Uncharacterized protein n=1 Tax=Ramazzottius varieornatus TaxID=947166 RepID=A0A1D1VHH2_RAMVA|nr:hypothetical protein RvY_11869 [Ramazzottius varieornatus]
MATLYQCEVIKSTVAVKHTQCGYEPVFRNRSVSLDGYTLVLTINPRLHTNNRIEIGQTAYSYNGTEWVPMTATVAVSRLHLAKLLNYTADSTALTVFQNVNGRIGPKKMMQCGRKEHPKIHSSPSAPLYPQPDGATYTENPSTARAVCFWLSNKRGRNIVERI